MNATNTRLLIPRLAGVYATMTPIAFLLFRVIVGVALVTHGWGKIQNPFGATGMVESLGFYPGVFWSPLLAATEFFGGILIAIGLLTRPASFAAFIVLLVTVYFHWIVQGEGFSGAEKSVIWSAALFYLAFAGGGRYSVDARIGREV